VGRCQLPSEGSASCPPGLPAAGPPQAGRRGRPNNPTTQARGRHDCRPQRVACRARRPSPHRGIGPQPSSRSSWRARSLARAVAKTTPQTQSRPERQERIQFGRTGRRVRGSPAAGFQQPAPRAGRCARSSGREGDHGKASRPEKRWPIRLRGLASCSLAEGHTAASW